MSYLTNGLSLRLGYTTTWQWHQVAPHSHFHLAEKIKNYLFIILIQAAAPSLSASSEKNANSSNYLLSLLLAMESFSDNKEEFSRKGEDFFEEILGIEAINFLNKKYSRHFRFVDPVANLLAETSLKKIKQRSLLPELVNEVIAIDEKMKKKAEEAEKEGDPRLVDFLKKKKEVEEEKRENLFFLLKTLEVLGVYLKDKKKKDNEIIQADSEEKNISYFVPGHFKMQRKNSFVFFRLHFFLDLLRASVAFEKQMVFGFSRAFLLLKQWLTSPYAVHLENLYIFFWKRKMLALLKNVKKSLVKNIKKWKAIRWFRYKKFMDRKNQIEKEVVEEKNDLSDIKRIFYKQFRIYFRTYSRRYKRKFRHNSYYRATARALLALFIFPLDVTLLASFIAQELGRLRQYHKKYLAFLRKTLRYALKAMGSKVIQGIRIIINGQLTNYRRRMKRSQMTVISLGTYVRNDLSYPVFYAQERAFNRFGILGVNVSIQFKNRFSSKEGILQKENGFFLLNQLVSAQKNFYDLTLFSKHWENFEKKSSNVLEKLDLSLFWMKKKPWMKKKKFSLGKKSKRFDVAILRENSLLEKIRQSSRQKIFNSLVFRRKKKLIKKEN